VVFYFYTRSWRVPAIKAVIDQTSTLPNCVTWYSADASTGVPTDVPTGVRLAWLSVTEDDVPPTPVGLVFRGRALRSHPVPADGRPFCPAEDGAPRPRRVTCDVCGRCWHPAPEAHRTPLQLIDPTEPG